ncbi:lysophospholipase L1-like esterase [Sanguibacter antarcticus]|uniref:Lysophospholipase L1-like esterase n=1 Tax=Sanguibacter antarcticus TaxID=372484 RepID=A0A2A9EAS1_9MICO|nr:lysophospholipase L1-like esterase [Sanguibacter antarcticus]
MSDVKSTDGQADLDESTQEQATTLPPPAPWSRYIAIGDSFTEGLWDLQPEDETNCRGWADMLAMNLSHRRIAAGLDPLLYANLAIRGRLLRPIIAEQLPAALEMKPDLVSLIGGGNDILRPNVDVDVLSRSLEAAVVRIRESGADVLLSTGVDASDSPLMGLTRGRVGIFNANVWSIAQRHGAFVMDQWGMRALRDWRMWAPDRIHLTTDGHRRISQGALIALGQEPDDAQWDDPLAPLPPVPRLEWARENALWLREHVAPWAARRIRKESSGDARTAKYPELVPFG